MLLQLGIVIVIITIGVIFAAGDLGSGGPFMAFLGGFGLLTIIAIIALIIMINKAKNRNQSK